MFAFLNTSSGSVPGLPKVTYIAKREREEEEEEKEVSNGEERREREG
jgi:hypothetical protein